ncbi:MAG: rhodanese-like domain-containing protein [Xanthomonadales bacterium]|nr:rhodanese-like domain-containing protein [Xanthomonadales bacterium]
MEQLLEFAGNHPLLSLGFVAVFLALIWTEIQRRAQGFRELPVAQAVPLINRDNTVVVDVSAVADYNQGHIVGAKHVPLKRFDDPDAELQRLKGQSVLVADKNGQTAARAAAALVKLGAAEVAVLKGGMMAWKAENYPVTRN